MEAEPEAEAQPEASAAAADGDDQKQDDSAAAAAPDGEAPAAAAESGSGMYARWVAFGSVLFSRLLFYLLFHLLAVMGVVASLAFASRICRVKFIVSLSLFFQMLRFLLLQLSPSPW